MADKNLPTNFMGGLGLEVPRAQALAQADARRISGAEVGRALGALGGGIATGIKNRGDGGFLSQMVGATGENLRNAEDRVIANETGIPLQAIQDRRRVKTHLEQYTPTSSDPMQVQIEYLEEAVRTARDPDLRIHLGKQLSMAKMQQAELGKLKAEQAADEEFQNVVGPDGNVVAAIIDPETRDAYAGEVYFPAGSYRLAGESFKTTEGDSASAIGDWINETTDPQSRRAWRQAVLDGTEALEGYAGLADFISSAGDDTEFLGTSGKINSALASGWKTFKAVVNVAGDVYDAATEKSDLDLQNRITSDRRWLSKVPLPPGVEWTAAQAELYQAKIMEMAFLEARMFEPSNRGLSDNDIEAALARLTANSQNPKVIVQNLAGKMTQQNRKLNRLIGTIPTNEQFSLDAVMDGLGLGNAFAEYQDVYRQAEDQFGIITGNFGRTETADPAVPIEPATGLTTEQQERLDRLGL